MTLPRSPLTHHEILRLVGPFTRSGRRVDLAASDRIARRLVFKPIEREVGGSDGASMPGLRESLQLESQDAGGFRLTRVLTLVNGLEARLQTDGPEPGELLARIEGVPAQRQFQIGPGYAVGRSHRVEAGPAGPAGHAATFASASLDSASPGVSPTPEASTREAPPPRLVLTRGTAQVGALTVTLDPPTVRGMLADLRLAAAPGEALALPDDLLAVLGRDWSRLAETADGWRSSLRLRGRGLSCSRDAEAKLERVASHLARCLAEPPARFHERHRAARWRVVASRSLPLLTCIALLLATASVPKLHLADNSPWRMLIFNAPPLLLILVFCLRELPRIEIPPWPRRSSAAAWQTPAAAAVGADAAGVEPAPEMRPR